MNSNCNNIKWHNAEAMWSPGPRCQNSYIWFKTRICAGQDCGEFRLLSTVPYQLFCNGKLCGWGPWRGTHNLLWVNSHDLSSYLHEGENEIWLLMHDPGVPASVRDAMPPMWMGEVTICNKQGEEVYIPGDDTRWICAMDESWEPDVLQSWYMRGFSEYYRMHPGGHNPFPHKGLSWTKPAIYPQQLLNSVGVDVSSGSPPMDKLIKPKSYCVKSMDDIPYTSSEVVDEYFAGVQKMRQQCDGAWFSGWLDSQDIVSPIKYLPPGGNKIEFAVIEDCWRPYNALDLPDSSSVAVLFDLGGYLSGLWHIEISSSQSATVHILYGEELLASGALDHPIENSDRLDVVPGDSKWTSFQPRGARYVLLVIDNASAVKSLDFGVIDTAYNKPVAEHVASKDAFLDFALKASAKTLALCLSDSFMDCAGRERNQWVGDSLLSAQVVADIFGDSEPWRRLLRSVVSVSVPGDILRAVVPGPFSDRVPIYDFMAVQSAVNYASIEDGSDIMWLLSFIKERIRTYYRYMRVDGLLENVPGRNFQDWTYEAAFPPLTRDLLKDLNGKIGRVGKRCYDFLDPRTRGINAVTNAAWLRALESALLLLDRCDDADYAEFDLLYKNTKQSYTELFWDQELGFVRERIPLLDSSFAHSELPNYAALSAGLLSQDQAKKVLQNCTSPEYQMIRVMSPYGAALVVEGLLRYGMTDMAYDYIKRVYSLMLEESDTLWECFDCGSKVHGWGAYPIWLYWKSTRC